MKNLFLIYLTFIMSSLTISLSAQTVDQNLLNVYNEQTIYLDGSINKYYKNNVKKKTGLFEKKIEQEFENASTEAKQEIEKYRKHYKRGNILLTTGSVIIVAGFIAAPHVTLAVYLGITGAGLIPYTAGAVDFYKAPKHLNKAVWLLNRDIMTMKQ